MKLAKKFIMWHLHFFISTSNIQVFIPYVSQIFLQNTVFAISQKRPVQQFSSIEIKMLCMMLVTKISYAARNYLYWFPRYRTLKMQAAIRCVSSYSANQFFSHISKTVSLRVFRYRNKNCLYKTSYNKF